MVELVDYRAMASLNAEEYLDIALRLSSQVQQEHRVKLDVVYGAEERQKIDLYLPGQSAPDPAPVLLFIHGGYWVRGHKDILGFMAPAITCLPAVFVSVGYRLAPGCKYPGPVDDCRRALRWVYQNIGNYGGDPQRIFVGGHSAGGHLASLITLQRPALEGIGLPGDVIKGCFPVSGVFDVADTPAERRAAFLNAPEEAPVASPLEWVAGNSVPFILEIGEKDFPNLKSQHPRMLAALEKQPGVVEGLEMEGLNHFQISLDNGDINGAWATRVRGWMAAPPGRR